MARWLVLVGAIVIQLILGTVYGYSIFWEPLTAEVFPEVITLDEFAAMEASGVDVNAYEVVATEEDVSIALARQRGYLKYAFGICILSFALAMVLAGRVQDIKGPRFTATIGAVLMGMGFLIASLLNSPAVFLACHAAFVGGVALVLLMLFHAIFGRLDPDEIPALKYAPLAIVGAVVTAGILLGNTFVGQLGEFDKIFMLWGTIGFLAGVGIGFAYVCPIAALIKWFPNQKGLVSGIAVAGFGFGAYLFKGKTIGALGFINNNDITSFFLVHGLVCLVVVSLGAMMLSNPPGVVPSKTVTSDSTWQQTLRRPAFYIIWLMFFSGAMAGLMVIGIIKVFAGEQLVLAATSGEMAITEAARAELMLKGAEAVGWLAIFNAVGRVVWGFVSDWIGRYWALLAMFSFQAVMMFMLIGMNTELTIAVAASIVGFNFGGNFALFPSATADLFGAKNMGANYGWVFTSYGIAGVVGIAAGNVAKEQTGSYAAAFTIAAVLCIISAVLALVLRQISKRHAVETA